MFLVSFLRDQATTHLWPALVLDRRGVRHEHRSDQTPKFGDLLGALLVKVFLLGDFGSLLFSFRCAASGVCSFWFGANVCCPKREHFWDRSV
jgi:hypothetical protein